MVVSDQPKSVSGGESEVPGGRSSCTRPSITSQVSGNSDPPGTQEGDGAGQKLQLSRFLIIIIISPLLVQITCPFHSL